MSVLRRFLQLVCLLQASFARSESIWERVRDLFDRIDDGGLGALPDLPILGGGGDLTLKDVVRDRAVFRLFSRMLGTDNKEECLWPFGAIGRELTFDYSANRFFPDTAANYWSKSSGTKAVQRNSDGDDNVDVFSHSPFFIAVTPIFVTEGTSVIVKGCRPAARYFSLQTYSASDLFSTTTGFLRDTEIVMNPDNSTYEVQIGGNGGVNNIPALPKGLFSGVTWLMYRTYLPEDPASPAGSVPLPLVSLSNHVAETIGGFNVPYCGLAEPLVDLVTKPLYDTTRQILFRTPKRPIEWVKPPGQVTPFPNGDSMYLAAIVSSFRDNVVVIRGKAPTFGIDGQVRYWSVCQFSVPSSRTIDCVPDQDFPLDNQGYYTVVVSTVKNRPANAVLGQGVVWLQWGPVTTGTVALRFMVPQEGVDLKQFYPKSAYCSVETFEDGACLL
jgi:hypothetical protein